MAGKYIAPAAGLGAFTCPRCETLAPQMFESITVGGQSGIMKVSRCSNCYRFCIWEKVPRASGTDTYTLVYPDESPAPSPNDDLPDDVRADYLEAAEIVNRSPRGAAALVRVAVQRLCKHLGQPGKNINDDIAALVKAGLSPLIQQAMDAIRITGNEAVHPGQINLEDDRELALALFDFVNLIAENCITTPKRVQEMYERLPESKRAQVQIRDAEAGVQRPTDS